jgi:hypothetical protein
MRRRPHRRSKENGRGEPATPQGRQRSCDSPECGSRQCVECQFEPKERDDENREVLCSGGYEHAQCEQGADTEHDGGPGKRETPPGAIDEPNTDSHLDCRHREQGIRQSQAAAGRILHHVRQEPGLKGKEDHQGEKSIDTSAGDIGAGRSLRGDAGGVGGAIETEPDRDQAPGNANIAVVIDA